MLFSSSTNDSSKYYKSNSRAQTTHISEPKYQETQQEQIHTESEPTTITTPSQPFEIKNATKKYSPEDIRPANIKYKQISKQRAESVMRKYNKYISQDEINQIYINTDKYCKQKDLDPTLLLALMARESSFNPYAVSSSNAKGLGQIMDFNFDSLGISNPYNIEENIRGSVAYFYQKLIDFKDKTLQVKLALASYKEGSGAIKRAGFSYSDHTSQYIEDILTIRSNI